jgi:hypothetical protein
MDLTISMNTVLNFLHSMALSTSNKRWLADHLLATKCLKPSASDASLQVTNANWPISKKMSKRKYMLDTNVCIFFLQGKYGIKEKIQLLAARTAASARLLLFNFRKLCH